MNKCEIEDCELCAPLKGKYYHHAYENAKNVRFCNSNKNATFLSKFSGLQLHIDTAWKMLQYYLVKDCNGPRKCRNFELHLYLIDLNCNYFYATFQNARDLLAKLKRKEKLAKVTSKFESRVDLVPAKPAEKDVHWCW